VADLPSFVTLPHFTVEEAEAIRDAIENAVIATESMLTVATAPENRAVLAERLMLLWSVRIAFAEAVPNHPSQT
jgi:hypothetical protein